MKEKVLKARAALLANEQGIRVHGELNSPPSKHFMDKILKARRLDKAYNEEQKETQSQDPNSTRLHETLKFTMREDKQHQMLKEALGSLDNNQMLGMTQTSELGNLNTLRSEASKSVFKSTNSTLSKKVNNVNDLFYKSHVSGFPGVKKKYAIKPTGDITSSYSTNFYRS